MIMRPRDLRRARAGLLALSVILVLACSDHAREPTDPASEPGDLAPVPVIGANTKASATIDSRGGTLSATAIDGTRYTLEVPAHARREPAEIAITPIASFENFPVAAGASAAVLFEPNGLAFTVPAELTIAAPPRCRRQVSPSPSPRRRSRLRPLAWTGARPGYRSGISAVAVRPLPHRLSLLRSRPTPVTQRPVPAMARPRS